MDIVYRKPVCQDTYNPEVQHERIAQSLEFTNWKEENRRRRIETKDWIKKRGYIKPDSISNEGDYKNRNRRIRPEVQPFRNRFSFEQSEDERFNKEIEYWKQFIINSSPNCEPRQKTKKRTG